MTITSLPTESLRFLDDLAKHNDKRWFDDQREDYERCDTGSTCSTKSTVLRSPRPSAP